MYTQNTNLKKTANDQNAFEFLTFVTWDKSLKGYKGRKIKCSGIRQISSRTYCYEVLSLLRTMLKSLLIILTKSVSVYAQQTNADFEYPYILFQCKTKEKTNN